MLRPFAFLHVADQTLGRVLLEVKRSFDQLTRIARLDCVTLSGVTLSGPGDTVVPHLLGRQPVGWDVIDQVGQATLCRSAWDEKSLTLNSSATCIVALEVW